MLQKYSLHTMPLTTHFLYKNGLEFLLCESEEEKNLLLQKKAVSTVVPKTASQNPPIKPAPKSVPAYSSPRSSEEAREKAENPQEGQSYPYPILADYQWPDTWEYLWKRTVKVQSPQVIWTYPGLHQDLTSQENSARKILIRRLRESLGKVGTHGFWPFDALDKPGEVLFEKEAHLFWSGIHKLKPRVLFIFGSQSRDALLLPKKGNYTSFNYLGYLVHIFPDPNRIIEKEEDINTLQIFMKKKLEMSLGL